MSKAKILLTVSVKVGVIALGGLAGWGDMGKNR